MPDPRRHERGKSVQELTPDAYSQEPPSDIEYKDLGRDFNDIRCISRTGNIELVTGAAVASLPPVGSNIRRGDPSVVAPSNPYIPANHENQQQGWPGSHPTPRQAAPMPTLDLVQPKVYPQSGVSPAPTQPPYHNASGKDTHLGSSKRCDKWIWLAIGACVVLLAVLAGGGIAIATQLGGSPEAPAIVETSPPSIQAEASPVPTTTILAAPTVAPISSPTAVPSVAPSSASPTPGLLAFATPVELRDAVDAYLLDNGPDTEVALAYGHPIGTWDVSLITDFSELFDAVIRNAMAADFDEDISTWNTGRATTMFAMFDGARAFNQNLSGWNVARVVDMDFMFSGCASFESDLSGWNTGSVQLAAFMFADAVRFVSPPQAIPAIAATDFLPYSFSHLLRRTVIYPGQPAP